MIGRCFQFGTFLKVFENESFIPWKLYEYELLLTLRVDFLIDGHTISAMFSRNWSIAILLILEYG